MGTWKRLSSWGCCWCAAGGADAQAAERAIEVLSNRADLISAGDALVAVDLPPGSTRPASGSRVNGRDVTGEFARPRRTAASRACSTGLQLGRNVAHRAARPTRSGAKLTITNHPNGGPVFSGPQIQPWVCQDDRRRRAVQPAGRPTSYKYMPTAAARFEPYDPESPPVRRRHDDHRPGQDGAVHRPHRDRLPGPRPVQDRRPLRPGEAVGAVGAAGAAGTTSC